jgi:predicted nucleic acid-binding protein
VSAFADSSALVKLYIPEVGHEQVRCLSALVVSQVASVEVPAAIWRKYRMGGVTLEEVRLLVAAFEADFYGTNESRPRFGVVPVSNLIFQVAARLTGVHGLRAYDAVQLATAQLTRSTDPECRTFVAFDKNLGSAAAAEGFRLIT